MSARAWWKEYYRLLRIARREAARSLGDTMLYGTGVTYFPGPGDLFQGEASHIPLRYVRIEEEGAVSAGR